MTIIKDKIDTSYSRKSSLTKQDKCNYPDCDFVSSGEERFNHYAFNELTGYNYSTWSYRWRDISQCGQCKTPVCSEHIHMGICRLCRNMPDLWC
jgi:hypothetical protein